MNRFGLALLVSVIPMTAAAQHPAYVMMATDQSKTLVDYVDINRIAAPDRDTRKAWVISIIRAGYNRIGIDFEQEYIKYDCISRSTTILQADYYRANGSSVFEAPAQGSLFAPPGSIAEIELNYVCRAQHNQADAVNLAGTTIQTVGHKWLTDHPQ